MEFDLEKVIKENNRINAELAKYGFCIEWSSIFGMMIGRMAGQMGWDKLDLFLMDFVSVARASVPAITKLVKRE